MEREGGEKGRKREGGVEGKKTDMSPHWWQLDALCIS